MVLTIDLVGCRSRADEKSDEKDGAHQKVLEFVGGEHWITGESEASITFIGWVEEEGRNRCRGVPPTC